MNVNSLTIKAQEALQAAYTLAQQRGQQAIEPLHMLSVLIRDDDALCTFLLGRVGVNVRGLRDEADRAVGSLPQVTGGNGEQYFSQAPRASSSVRWTSQRLSATSMRRSNICCSA